MKYLDYFMQHLKAGLFTFVFNTIDVTVGSVVSVDSYWSLIQIGNISIDFSEIAELEIIPKPV